MTEATSPRGWMLLVGGPLAAFALVLYYLYGESVGQFVHDFAYWLDYALPDVMALFK